MPLNVSLSDVTSHDRDSGKNCQASLRVWNTDTKWDVYLFWCLVWCGGTKTNRNNLTIERTCIHQSVFTQFSVVCGALLRLRRPLRFFRWVIQFKLKGGQKIRRHFEGHLHLCYGSAEFRSSQMEQIRWAAEGTILRWPSCAPSLP